MSLLSWFKGFFNKKAEPTRSTDRGGFPTAEATNALIKNILAEEEREEAKQTQPQMMEYQVIFASDASYICPEAARVCIGAHMDEDKKIRLETIERIVKRGHESVIAHSNIVILVSFSDYYYDELMHVIPAMKFLNIATNKKIYDNGEITNYLLIGGSIRAYKYFIRNAYQIENSFVQMIIDSMYHSCESAFFVDMIEDGIMEKIKFGYETPHLTKEDVETVKDKDGNEQDEEVVEAVKEFHQPIIKGKQVDIWFSDPFLEIYDFLKNYGFTLKDLLQILTCTILFHDFSRATSQQLTRHRGAISQESQRYVNAKDSKFINPTKFNTTQYGKTERYTIKLFGVEKQMTAQALGTELKGVYTQLLNQKMLKQDARGYLPFNVSTKVMFTFTYADLLHFIYMRDSPGAQPEIRKIAQEIENLLSTEGYFKSIVDLYSYQKLIDIVEQPNYKKEEEDYLAWENNVDEPVGKVREEIIEGEIQASAVKK